MPAFLESGAPYLSVVALLLTGALLRFSHGERSVYLNTLWLFLLGVAGQAAAPLLSLLDFPRAAANTHAVFRIVAALAFIRIAGFSVFRLAAPLLGRRPPRIVEDLAIIGIYVIYGFAQLSGAGVDLSSILTTSAILTAVLAFAMQDTLGNILAGIAIQLDHSVQVGDWVRLGELSGRVRDIRWRSALIETRNWETLVVPNSMLMKSSVAIIGRREGMPLQWRRNLPFLVDPGVPPARVIATLDDEMREAAIPNVARVPAPSCILAGFEDGNLRYQLRYWLTDLLEDEFTDSMVRVHLFASLQRAGIRVAEPQRTVHAVTRDEAHAETVRKRELTRRLELIRGVDLFAGLSEEEKEDIAERLQYAPFARGDVITKQGDTAQWLYIVAFGEAEAVYESPSGATRAVGTIHPGEFFGEMALFAGDARHATVIAKTDVECYRLDHASVQGLLLSRPQIAEHVSKVVGTRRAKLVHTQEALAAAPSTDAGNGEADLLGRIRRFFGLRS
ncbi:MAG TPA: mechanosensitive ion channel family protein [Burkholderiales bacterium]|nr:mechanosensitive ion channel family protein [Burkholderiales bacterium]